MKFFISFAISLLLLIGNSNGQTIRTVGGSGANYTTLRQAFDAVNAGTLNGHIILQLTGSTTETATASLNASGNGSASYTSISIYPTETGITISGNLAAPLINLSGTSNVTIDGRVNANGSTKDLIIMNSNVSTASNTSTIRFINSAANNTIQYCNIKGGATGSYSAILLFAGSNSGNGNSGNLIGNCNLTGLNASDRPYAVAYSYGNSGRENSSNTISNNNIYDFLKADATSYGIYIYQYSTAWTIDGNSFFETTDFVPSANASYYAIRVLNASGNNFSITNNYIGGKEALCGGSPLKMNTTMASRFYGIHLDVGTITPSSVQGNTIRNFDITNSNSTPWMGIDANSGAVNIGTINGNTIGSDTGNGSVLLTNSNAGSPAVSYGIYVNSSGTVVISNNKVGSVTTQSSNSIAHSFYGIYKAGNVSGDMVVSNNLIGSLTTSNSIQTNTVNTSSAAQNVYGIISSASGSTIISYNTVANLFDAHAYQYATNGQVVGIYTSKGINTIQNNIVRNLTCSSPTNDAVGNAAAIGISQQSTTGDQTITGNTVSDLNSTYNGTRPVNVTGIFYYGGTSGTNTIKGNLIHGLMASSASASLTGIKVYAGTSTIANNIINLGEGVSTGLTINGLYENGNAGNNNSMWFNTVYIGGTVSGTTSSTYALYSVTNNNSRDFRNNVLYNARTGGTTGNHYAIRIGGMAGVTINYNDYFILGSPAILGQIGTQNKATFSDWKLGTTQDVNSLNINPGFANAGGTNFTDYYASSTLPGVPGTGITIDYAGLTRPSAPRMGALESNNYVWMGGTNEDFATASNWEPAEVPTAGADITFAASPTHNCVLDQNRTVGNFTNTQSTYKLITNGHRLTITKNLNLSNGAQIDASSASSIVVFAGITTQSIPSGAFVSSTVDGLTLNNSAGLTLNGDLTVVQSLALSSGDFSIGANTLTLNGAISLTSGTLTGGISSNLIFGGTTTTSLPAITLNNLTLNRSGGITLSGNITVGGILSLSAGTLTVGTNILNISGSSPTSSGGTIDASNASATLIFANASAITLPATFFSGSVNNLILSGSGGVIAGNDFTVNGVLNLAVANPDETKGLLEMTKNYGDYSNIITPDNELTTRGTKACDILDSYILTMGPSASFTGSGDVTGRVKRTSIAANTEYFMGSSYSSITFSSAGTLPTAVMFVITKGSDRGIHANATAHSKNTVQRLYQIIQTGGAVPNTFSLKLRYLDSELNDNDESRLVLWDHHIKYTSANTPHEHGKTSQNSTENWVSLSGHDINYLATQEVVDGFTKYWMINASEQLDENINTWLGAATGDDGYEWDYASNWTKGTVPTSSSKVIIPLTAKEPTLAETSTAATITIEAGAVLNGGTGTTLIVSGGPALNGGVGSWNNAGTFNSGTSTVVFDYSAGTYDGTTNFNNLTINSGKELILQAASVMRIGGTFTRNGTLNSHQYYNTVEYYGASQLVVDPGGSPSAYQNLILSGSGTKTMPAAPINILGNFVVSGTASATANNTISVQGNLSVDEGASFGTGAFNHEVKGNIVCNGTIIPSTGNLFTVNGNAPQAIEGEVASINLGGLTILNAAGVSLYTPAVTADLNIESGSLTVIAGTTLTVEGETNLSSAECLVLKSDAEGTASFKDNGTITGTGTARIERNLSPYDEVSDQKFHFISSPVGDAQAIEPKFIDLTSSAITDFYKWDEESNLWINFRGDEFNVRNEAFGDGFNFVAGKGYMVAYPEASVRNFTGKPCTSALGLTIQCTNTDNRGWNLLGNPFPSSIDWDLVTKGDGMDAALYYYDNATASYQYYTNLTGGLGDATQYIAPMQGFMVHAKASGVQTITMANAARTHQGAGVFFKNAPLTANVLNLMVEGNGAKDYTRICFYEQATEAFDGDFDAYKLFSYNESAAQLYTVSSDNIPLAINTMPLSQLRTTKKLNFMPGAGGEYTLTAENLERFTDQGTITLKDLKTGQQQKLTDNPVYTFTAEAGNDPNRFELIFGTGAASDDEQPLTEFRLWISNNTLCVSEPQSGASLSIFDMQGRAILSGIMDGSSYLLPLMLPEGIYIVRLINDKDIYTSKVFMK
ncbi:MAG: T9SS type A sorting domain-containing protein [Lentimicrobium sp.]|jgi:hypothetical protein|nr:T9SS type A sorting domain-containing protein [Lentimicrobium sp.]